MTQPVRRDRLRSGAILLLSFVAVAASAGAGQMAGPEGDPLAPIGGAWTYQGFLAQNGAPANGPYDFEFALFDAPVAGVQVGSTVTHDNLAVGNGVFQALLGFGGTGFYGDTAKWLEIRVRPGASGGAYTPLSPRQFVSPAPVALSLPNVYSNQGQNFVGVGRTAPVSGNERFGVRSESGADVFGGMYVETSDAEGWPFYGFATNGVFQAWTYFDPTGCGPVACPFGEAAGWKLVADGIRLEVPRTGGLRIGAASPDAVRINEAADDGVQVGQSPDYPSYGLYIPSPGVPNYGLWPNTEQAAGQWGLFTVDNIEAGNVFALAQTQIARFDGEDELLPGDVVAVVGYGPALVGHHDAAPTVVAAGPLEAEAVIGVVQSRMFLRVHPDKSGEDATTLESAEGPAKPGDFVAVTVRGVALVRSDAGAEVGKGQRLTVGDVAGQARPLRSKVIEGMVVSEGLPSIGIALGPSGDDGLVPVYVDVR